MRLRSSIAFAIPIAVAAGTFLLLQSTCGAPEEVAVKKGLRIATYNIQWLNERMSKERETNLKSVIRNLNADVIALQEIEGRRALGRIFGPGWRIGILDERAEFQELAIAIKAPLKFVGDVKPLFPDPALDQAFPGKRDVLRAVVQTPNGFRIAFYVVHMKSRSGGRQNTDARRIMACGLLAAYIRARAGEDVVVLGDFNDTPDDASVNILETGDLLAAGSAENEPDRFLVNLTEPLMKEDGVTFGLHQLFRGVPIAPRVKGARTENGRWRGRSPRYPEDLAVTQSLFDQLLVSKGMAEIQAGTARIYAGRDALRGKPGRARRASSGYVSYEREGSLASDHLPVYADFRIQLN